MPMIACRSCKEPDCTNCNYQDLIHNMYILENALKQGKLKSLMDDKNKIQIENIETKAEGEWIKMSDADGIYWACSVCGEELPRISRFNPQFDLFPRYESIDKTRHCPSCGVKMKN